MGCSVLQADEVTLHRPLACQQQLVGSRVRSTAPYLQRIKACAQIS